jgi:5-methylthioadenosine/S-adenosylhomocysteine deaminase
MSAGQADYLVCGDWLIVSPWQVLADGAVAVNGGVIVEAGPASDLGRRYPAARCVGGTDRLVMPGLINTHTHLFQSLVKGLGQGLALPAWVKQVMVPAALALKPRDAYLAAMVSLLDALHSGTTSIFEYAYALPDPEVHAASFQALADVGLRGWVGIGLNDAGEETGLHPALIQPINAGLKRVEALRQYATDSVAAALAPTSIRGLSWVGLQAIGEYCAATGLTCALHVNESVLDNQVAQFRFGRPAVASLEAAGLLGPQLLAVHAVHMQPDEIARFAAAAARVSHNPVSNMYLGAGTAPVAEMRAAGIAVGLGTDGAASNNCQDMLESVKVAALGQRLAAGRPDAFTAGSALALATVEGARALRQEGRLGSLSPGCQADLAVLRTDVARFGPVHDVLSAVVFSGGAAQVETVMVGGRMVLDQGCVLGVDEPALLREAEAAARSLVARAGLN